jgi:hypothetical protein
LATFLKATSPLAPMAELGEGVVQTDRGTSVEITTPVRAK